jgi:hypothetical protein
VPPIGTKRPPRQSEAGILGAGVFKDRLSHDEMKAGEVAREHERQRLARAELLERLALSLAAHAGLPLTLARQRVQQLSVSARPRAYGNELLSCLQRYG